MWDDNTESSKLMYYLPSSGKIQGYSSFEIFPVLSLCGKPRVATERIYDTVGFVSYGWANETFNSPFIFKT